jgi:hypothetical protein
MLKMHVTGFKMSAGFSLSLTQIILSYERQYFLCQIIPEFAKEFGSFVFTFRQLIRSELITHRNIISLCEMEAMRL